MKKLKEICQGRGFLRPVKSEWELFRLDTGEGKAIVYKSGKVVFHESLKGLLIEIMEEEPGIEVGSDEAGKGEEEGALVISAVALDHNARKWLRAEGLLESKSIPPKRLDYIYRKVVERAQYISSKIITPSEFRSRWNRGNLNLLLAEWHREVIEDCLKHVKAKRIVIDSFDKRKLEEALSGLDIQVILEPRADTKYVSVAAASVVAKYLRESGGWRGRKWS